MTIERKLVPYDVTLRFSTGERHHNAVPGALEGAHFIEAEIITDTTTGEVLNRKIGAAQPLPADRVSTYLGDNFTIFEAGLQAERVAHAAEIDAYRHKEDLQRETTGKIIAELKEMVEARDGLQNQVMSLYAQLTTMTSERNAARTMVEDLTARLAALELEIAGRVES